LVGQDRCEELAHFVSGTAGHGVVGVIADLVEVIADILDR
jgi:hypothetical protein